MMYEKPKRYDMPKTVDEVVELLVSDLMASHVRVLIKMAESDFEKLYEAVAAHITDEFGLWTGNSDLLNDCIRLAEIDAPFDPGRVILDKLRRRITEELGAVIIT